MDFRDLQVLLGLKYIVIDILVIFKGSKTNLLLHGPSLAKTMINRFRARSRYVTLLEGTSHRGVLRLRSGQTQ